MPAPGGAASRGHASALDVIASEPGAARFGAWNGTWPGLRASPSFLARASVEAAGNSADAETYRILGGHCGHWADSPSRQAAYHNWISSFARGVSGYRAVLFLEMDSLITVGCLSRHGVDVRMDELRDAINDPHRSLPAAGRSTSTPAPPTQSPRRASLACCGGPAWPRSRASSSTQPTSTGPRRRSASVSRSRA